MEQRELAQVLYNLFQDTDEFDVESGVPEAEAERLDNAIGRAVAILEDWFLDNQIDNYHLVYLQQKGKR